MPPRRRFLCPLVCLSLGIASIIVSPSFGPLVSSAAASVSVELSLPFLSKQASLIVVGSPVESHAMWEQTGGARRIVTYHKLHVEQKVEGTDTPQLWVRCLGGQVGDIAQRVEGEAVLRPGESALIFLVPRMDGTHAVLGMAQGLFPIARDDNGIARLKALRAPGVLMPAPHATRRHDELVGRELSDAIRIVRAARRSHGQ